MKYIGNNKSTMDFPNFSESNGCTLVTYTFRLIFATHKGFKDQ